MFQALQEHVDSGVQPSLPEVCPMPVRCQLNLCLLPIPEDACLSDDSASEDARNFPQLYQFNTNFIFYRHFLPFLALGVLKLTLLAKIKLAPNQNVFLLLCCCIVDKFLIFLNDLLYKSMFEFIILEDLTC